MQDHGFPNTAFPTGTTIPIKRFLAAIMVTALAESAHAHAPGVTVKPNFSHALPNVPGKSLVSV